MRKNGDLTLHDDGTDGDSSANNRASSDQNLTMARAEKVRALNKECDVTIARWIESGFFNPTPPQATLRTGKVVPDEVTIYFVGPVGGPIKIGYAERLEFRLRDLRTANAFPLVVHATVKGGQRLEREYHEQFKAHRLHGEWFAPHPDILAEIDRLNAQALFK